MKVLVLDRPPLQKPAELLKSALGAQRVKVIGATEELPPNHLIVTDQVDAAMQSRAALHPVIATGPTPHDRAFWLERGVEWVPEGDFEELVARCRSFLERANSVPPARYTAPPEDVIDSGPMQPLRITRATFEVVAQVCRDALIGFYQLEGDGGLRLFAESEDGKLPDELPVDLPTAQPFASGSSWSCEICVNSDSSLAAAGGLCHMAHVESDSRRYGLLVVVLSADSPAPPEDAIVHAARQLAYGLEASYLFSQVRRAYGSLRETKDQLVHAEKFAAVGLLAAEIAHEINNPASFVITNLSVLGDYAETIAGFHQAIRTAAVDGLNPEQLTALEEEYEIGFLEEDLETLIRRSLAGLERIHQIVQDLRFTSNVRSTSSGLVNVERLIESAIGLVRHEAKFRAAIKLDFGGVPMVDTDPNRLSQVFLNLLVNAVQAIHPGAVDENEVEVSTRHEDGKVFVSVRDTGQGVEESLRRRIFEPFFTTKEPGSGTGLGLSISRDIIRGMGGELTFDSEVGVGSTFTVMLPATDPGHDS